MSLDVKDTRPRKSEPAWEIARLFPHQGHWSSVDYLDLEIKRAEYTEAAIPEYWIVDPQEQRITVLTLDASGDYSIHGQWM